MVHFPEILESGSSLLQFQFFPHLQSSSMDQKHKDSVFEPRKFSKLGNIMELCKVFYCYFMVLYNVQSVKTYNSTTFQRT